MGDYTPFCNTYSDEEEIRLLKEYKRFEEKPLDKKLKKWVEFRKVCSVKPDYTVVQLSKKVRGFSKKFEDKKNSSPPTHPHKARIFQLSNSIWGDAHAINKRALHAHAHHHHKPLKKIKVEQVGDEFKELRLKELHLYHQSLLLEMEKQKLKLQLLKLEMKQSVENQNQGSTENPDDDEEEEEEEEEEGEETDLLREELAKSSDDDKMEGGDQNQPSETEMNVNHDLAIYEREKDVDDNSGKMCANEELKRTKGKAVELNSTTLSSGIIIQELAQGKAKGKIASLGRKVRVIFIAKLKGAVDSFESNAGESLRSIVLGREDGMIDGLHIGIQGMRVGGKRRLIIPPSMGYGEEGFGDVVPPNSWLEYEVHLVAVGRRSD